ncbi:RWD domain-containing protein 2B-like isoform X2 [Sphaeramia orbicularis]|uniref:RWD domain-containing protein 2B-like n=1 Tax=Sphaeramia orbicularis TaxID=375764 RepID=A0A673CA81_9TELE|nr:RWD domain-containing protein 2B-like isoform X2 [Sphaeramia orbicularis]
MSYLEWAESQLAEIELLTSMFPTQEELEMTDQLAVAELRHYVEGSSDSPPPSRPQFLIKQSVDSTCTEKMDVIFSCAYPSEYPSVLPEITVRCAGLSRAQQTQLHADLNTFLMENCQGEVCVLTAVDWVKDNLQPFISRSLSATAIPKKESAPARPQEVFSRLWIYSHHIYNKTKRKNILEWSKELCLSGFSMPGKPGIVCVEGPQSACEEFWSRVKVLTWKKIMIRHREDIPLDRQGEDDSAVKSIDSLRKFTGFEEAMFDPHGNRGNHMDLGQLYQFLNEKGCCDVFQIYFGIEGR